MTPMPTLPPKLRMVGRVESLLSFCVTAYRPTPVLLKPTRPQPEVLWPTTPACAHWGSSFGAGSPPCPTTPPRTPLSRGLVVDVTPALPKTPTPLSESP